MTIKVAVIGNPIKHSKSPRMHNYWLSKLEIDGSYEHLEAPIDGFRNKVRELISKGYVGANVTLPFKEEAFAIADQVTDFAQSVGAANTLLFKEGQIYADNTDGFGFGQNIIDYYPDWNVKGKHIVLGAGGAARGIVAWLVAQGAGQIVIVNRTVERIQPLQRLGKNIIALTWAELPAHIQDATTLINTTSRGMNGENDIIEISFDNAPKNLIVNDIVYTPLETGILKQARAANLRVVDGLGMLLWQARPGFKMWFDQEAPVIDQSLRELMMAP